MSAMVERRSGSDTERHRSRRWRNWAIFAALVGFVVLVYFVALIKMGGL